MERRAASAKQIVDDFRFSILASLDISRIQHMDADELVSVQSALGIGDKLGQVEFPIEWFPPGSCRSITRRRFDFRTNLAQYSSDKKKLDAAVLFLVRFMIISFLVPQTDMRAGSYFLASSTWASSVSSVLTMLKIVVESSGDFTGAIFDCLDDEGIAEIRRTKRLSKEANRIERLVSRDYLSQRLPRKVYGIGDCEDAPPSSPPVKNQFQPFSDEFVAEMGWRSHWIVDRLDYAIVNCLKQCIDIVQSIPGTGTHTEKKRSLSIQDLLAGYAWLDRNGVPITELPFEVNIIVGKKVADDERFSWPPENWSQLKSFVRLSQAAHLMIFMISTGGRISEALSLDPSNIRTVKGVHLVDGRTFKLVFADEGKSKEWPIPDIAMTALLNQRELVSHMRLASLNQQSSDENENENKSLWGKIGKDDDVDAAYGYFIASALQMLGLTELTGDTRPHAHRFRKTVARLIALAIAGAPKILMDLFGHETIEMTLQYILTDPLIRAEMNKVLKAQVVMLAEDAIADVESAGGPAVVKVTKAVEFARKSKRFGASNLHELAEMLTLSGTQWQIVRPGVLCTKLPQQAGACSRGTGNPEHSNCKSSCEHRFEHSFLKDDVHRVLDECVRNLVEAKADADEIRYEMWSGQVVANINRFNDVRDRWIDHPVVQEVLEAERMSGAAHL